MKMKKIRKMITTLILVTSTILMSGLFAHDDGHKSPKTLPSRGPHGGKFSKLTKHYGEALVKGKKVTIYILEKDVKNIAEDATRVSVIMVVPGRLKKKLRLAKDKKGGGYSASINIPRNTRRVYFNIKCILDKKWEVGKVLYEPRR